LIPTVPGTARGVRFDAVVTHHLDGFRSGVARFNELLAHELHVPLLGLHDPEVETVGSPLLSFKVSELGDAAAARVDALLARSDCELDFFMHEFSGVPLELRLIDRARRVQVGNDEIYAAVAPLHPDVRVLWAPGLLRDQRQFVETEITVFSFGMAHKLRIDYFERLRNLLEGSGKTYSLYLSAANHETQSLRDSESVFAEMREVFPTNLFFVGNLSDVAVANYLNAATFFAAFFTPAVRANNTSVCAAMDAGAVVITNMDEYSPADFVHLDNLLDIERCKVLPTDPGVLARLGGRAGSTAERRSWSRLVEELEA
jgi:hypothetical protein